jgi:hypothetical protein
LITSKRFWLLAPAWLLLGADVGLTLAGQPGAYWSGDYAAAVEGNPLAYPIIAQGPWVFASLAAVWAAVLGLLVYRVSHRFVSWFVIVLAFSHAVGGATWFVRFGYGGWILAIVYLFVAAEVSWWCWRRSGGVTVQAGSSDV